MIVSENLQKAYDEQYDGGNRAWRMLCAKHKVDNIVQVCRGLARPAKVLEVGAGEGSILEILDRRGFCDSLYALEISKSGLEQIRKRDIPSLKGLQLFNGYDIPFADNSFDLVILSHVIEHVEFPRRLLREIRRVSRHQVIEIPLDFTFGVDRNMRHFLDYGHINIYLPSLFRFLLKSEGFAVLEDMVSINEREVFFYSTFVNAQKPRTPVAVLVATLKVGLRKMALNWLPRPVGELVAHAYTVLCSTAE